MQALWSRAGSCRCSSCLHVATTLARRTTTAASKRRLKVSDVFTAFYSSVLATAAVADAKFKDDRRKQWDKAIAEARGPTPWSDTESLPNAEPEIEGPATGTSWMNLSQPSRAPNLSTFKPVWDNGRELGVPGTNFESKLRALDSEIQQSYSESVESKLEKGNEAWVPLGQGEAWYEEPDEILVEREPKSLEHLEWRRQAISKMVENFLLKVAESVKKGGKGQKPRQVRLELKEMILNIQNLRSGYTEMPVYNWEGIEIVERDRYELHRSLHELCKSADSKDPSSIELLVTKICYNLLVSTTPPSVVTYNVLLRELTRLRQHDLAQIVVDSYFYDTVFKPNHNTGVLLLEHFSAKDDPHGWRSVKNRMRAPNMNPKYNMRTRKRHMNLLAWRPGLQEWVLNNRVVQKGPYLIQKFPRDIRIFDSLIKGALKFNGAPNAIYHIRQALAEGQRVYSETLCSVIRKCLEDQDVRGSISLLQSIVSTLWNEDGDVSSIIFTRPLRYCLYQLFHMCGIKTTLESQATLPYDLPADMVQSMLRQMRIASVEDAVGRAEDYIETLELHIEANLYHYMVRDGFEERPVDEQTLSAPSEKDELSKSDSWQPSEALGSYKPTRVSPERHEKNLVYKKHNLKWLSITEKLEAKRRRRNEHAGHRRRLEFLGSSLTIASENIIAIEAQLVPIALVALPEYLQTHYIRWASLFNTSRGENVLHGRLEKMVQLQQRSEIPTHVQEQLAGVQALLFNYFPKESYSTVTGLDLHILRATQELENLEVHVCELCRSHMPRLLYRLEEQLSKSRKEILDIEAGLFSICMPELILINGQKILEIEAELGEIWLSNLQKQVLRSRQQLHKIEAELLATQLVILDTWIARRQRLIKITKSVVLAEVRKRRRLDRIKNLMDEVHKSGQRIHILETELARIFKPRRRRLRHLEEQVKASRTELLRIRGELAKILRARAHRFHTSKLQRLELQVLTSGRCLCKFEAVLDQILWALRRRTIRDLEKKVLKSGQCLCQIEAGLGRILRDISHLRSRSSMLQNVEMKVLVGGQQLDSIKVPPLRRGMMLENLGKKILRNGKRLRKVEFELGPIRRVSMQRRRIIMLEKLDKEIPRNIRALSDPHWKPRPRHCEGEESLLLSLEEKLRIREQQLGKTETQLCAICPETVKLSVLELGWQLYKNAQRICRLGLTAHHLVRRQLVLSKRKSLVAKTSMMMDPTAKKQPVTKKQPSAAGQQPSEMRKHSGLRILKLLNEPESDIKSSPRVPIKLSKIDTQLSDTASVAPLPLALVKETKSAAAPAAATA